MDKRFSASYAYVILQIIAIALAIVLINYLPDALGITALAWVLACAAFVNMIAVGVLNTLAAAGRSREQPTFPPVPVLIGLGWRVILPIASLCAAFRAFGWLTMLKNLPELQPSAQYADYSPVAYTLAVLTTFNVVSAVSDFMALRKRTA